MVAILDQYGKPIRSSQGPEMISVDRAKRMVLRAKYDAAQTFTGNEEHWSNADHLDPNAAASYKVRRMLRSRSRYETGENNPYLKGTLLSICNDFVKSGPRLQITDRAIPKEKRADIELLFTIWASVIKLRKKLWQLRMAKIVDGEGFARSFTDDDLPFPVKLNYQVFECDRVTSDPAQAKLRTSPRSTTNEIDGVRFDDFDRQVAYYILRYHPGAQQISYNPITLEGRWYNSEFVIHWYRYDRPWIRGIPELATSLPLCALLRRYTLAVVEHAEVAADLTAMLETDGPPIADPWTDGLGNIIGDEAMWDTFPIERGTVMNLPWKYKLKQLNAIPDGQDYETFTGALLREIIRPVLAPFNMAAGTSKESNMASAVVDAQFYKDGQELERIDCVEEVLDSRVLPAWWQEAVLSGLVNLSLSNPSANRSINRSRSDRSTSPPSRNGDSRNGSDYLSNTDRLRTNPPLHTWGWDKVGKDHTDPVKVATALQVMYDAGFLTDRDIQELHLNRDLEIWQEERMETERFRETLPSKQAERKQQADELAIKKQQAAKSPVGKPASKSSSKPAVKRRVAASSRRLNVSAIAKSRVNRIKAPSLNGHSHNGDTHA